MFHVEQRPKTKENAARRAFFDSDLKQVNKGGLQGWMSVTKLDSQKLSKNYTE